MAKFQIGRPCLCYLWATTTKVQFDREQIKDVWVLRIAGRLDFENHHHLRGELDWLEEQGKTKLVFNLKDVVAMSSSGAGAFVSLSHKLEKVGGALALSEVSKPCLHSLELLRLMHFFKIYASEKEAVDSLAE